MDEPAPHICTRKGGRAGPVLGFVGSAGSWQNGNSWDEDVVLAGVHRRDRSNLEMWGRSRKCFIDAKRLTFENKAWCWLSKIFGNDSWGIVKNVAMSSTVKCNKRKPRTWTPKLQIFPPLAAIGRNLPRSNKHYWYEMNWSDTNEIFWLTWTFQWQSCHIVETSCLSLSLSHSLTHSLYLSLQPRSTATATCPCPCGTPAPPPRSASGFARADRKRCCCWWPAGSTTVWSYCAMASSR